MQTETTPPTPADPLDDLRQSQLSLFDNKHRSLMDAFSYASRTVHPNYFEIGAKFLQQSRLISELFRQNEEANYTLLPELLEQGPDVPKVNGTTFRLAVVMLAKKTPERHHLLPIIADLEKYRFLVGNTWLEKLELKARVKFVDTPFEFIFHEITILRSLLNSFASYRNRARR